MKKLLGLLLLSIMTVVAYADTDTTRWVVCYPITDYIVGGNDSIRIVQVQLDPDDAPIALKTMGLLRGWNHDNAKDTAVVGAGRCQLIKANYCYFGIRLYKKNQLPKSGDLIYLLMPKPKGIFTGRITAMANHCIGFKTVSGDDLYRPFAVRRSWTEAEEKALLAAMVEDIHYTGLEMKKQMPGSNQDITDGLYKGKKLFDAMQGATEKELLAFLDYVTARPRLYAGNDWKISETFATWMVSGTPQVLTE